MRLTVAHTHPSVVLSHGGVQYSYQIASALQQAGFLKAFWTTFYHFKSSTRFPWFQNRFHRRYYEGLNAELIHSNPWPELLQRTMVFLFRKNSFVFNRSIHLRNRLFDLGVSRWLRKAEFDLFLGLSGGAFYSLREAKARGKIAGVDQHDIHYVLARRLLEEERELHPEFADSIPYWPPLTSYLECVEKEFNLADFILVPSSFALRSHLEAGIPSEKLILMPHGLNHFAPEGLPRARRENEKFRILFVGTITQRKGIKYLLEAVKRLRTPQIELILIGDQMASREALRPYRDYFQYAGYLSYEKLKDYFHQAHLLVLPSIYDAFGLAALDAMAAGLPVIVSEHTAAGSDVVRDGQDGFVVPIRDIGALEDRILRLYTNEPARIAMARSAQERVRQFSWDAYAQRLKDTIAHIYSSRLEMSYGA